MNGDNGESPQFLRIKALQRALPMSYAPTWTAGASYEVNTRFRVSRMIRVVCFVLLITIWRREEASLVDAGTKIATMKPATEVEQMGLFDSVRHFLAQISRERTEFYPSELHRLAYQSGIRMTGVRFRSGSACPYSEDFEDALSVLLATGEVRLSPNDRCKLAVSDSIRQLA
jgi:hypothetical protein